MWSRLTGKSDSGSSASNREKDDEARRRRTSDSTRSKRDRDPDARSVVSSTSTRKPSRRDTTPSSIASFATAFDQMPRSRANEDLYDSPRDEQSGRRRDDRPASYAASSVSTTRRDRSRSRDRDEKDRKKSKDKDKEKKSDKRGWTRPRSSSQAGGHHGDIVEGPKPVQRSFSGQNAGEGFSQFPGQAGAPTMSGALPTGSQQHTGDISSHVQDQFPGQNPAQYTSSDLPGGNPFGAAADYYNDQGDSVYHQPGVRPQPPSVIIGQDTPHLMSAAAQANPVADTGSGAAADFYSGSANAPTSKPPKPSRPSTSIMPGSFVEEGPAPQKPPRPSSKPSNSSKPSKPGKASTAATLAGGAALGYPMGSTSSSTQQHSTSYSSSNVQHSTSYSNGTPAAASYNPTSNGGPSASGSMYYQDSKPSSAAIDSQNYPATYSGAAYGPEGAPPPKPPRPAKPEKHSSGSNAGLYAAGAAGLAAYGLHQHNSHSNSQHTSQNYSSSTPGAFPGPQYNGNGNDVDPSSNPFMVGGMTQRHQHTGPVSRLVDWWKDYEDVQKMEEYTEYIGVCKGCFDPRSSVYEAPRKHHYNNKRRSSEYLRTSGGIEKQSRYPLKEKRSHNSLSSGDERRKRNSGNAAGWVAAGLGLAKAGKAVLNGGRDDFDDTYSIKSGRPPRSRVSHRSRSRSSDRKHYSYGSSEIRRRSRSRDRLSQMSVGVTKDKKDYKIVRRHSRPRSRSSSGSSSRDGRSGLIGTAIGAGLAGAALGAATKKKKKSQGSSRSRSPKKVYVQHSRRDSSGDERRRRRSQQLRNKSSRSSISGASVIEIGQTHQPQGGFLGGFFAAPPPKEKRPKATSHGKKKKGFFTFGNASTSSSDSEMAFGTGYVRRRRRASPKRRNSDERLKASLAGLGVAAAAIGAARAGRSANKRHSEVVTVKENRHGRRSSDRPRPGSRFGDDEWEDLPDDVTSNSSSDAGLVYGDYDWRKGKSQESLVSNGSGTNKWGWRWGFGKAKRKSSDNLYDNIANTSFTGPAVVGTVGALAGAAIGSGLGRHDSESSSVHTLQSVHPFASNDPNAVFDARRTSSVQTPQPLVTSGPGLINIQQPQPIHQVPGAIYSTQPSSQPGYVAPAGPPVFSQVPVQPPYQAQYQTQNVTVQAPQYPAIPSSLRRTNSSPIQSSSWRRDAAVITGLAAAAGAATVSGAKFSDSPSSSNVRFELTEEQFAKDERERRREQDRKEEEDRRRRDQERRDEENRREEEERIRREQQRRDDEARKAEEERVRVVQQRRNDEARKAEEERTRLEQQRRNEEAWKAEEERVRLVQQRQTEEARKAEEDRVRLVQQRRNDEARKAEEERIQLEQQRRNDEARKAEEDRRREQLRREDEAHQEEERRRWELQRQQDEARKYMEAERLVKVETERRMEERRRQQEEIRIREAREAEEYERKEREARIEAKRRADLEAEAEQMRRERRETERREAERIEAARREAEIREDTERRRREREAQEYADQYESDHKLERQRTGDSASSVTTVVRRKDKELKERERDIVQPDTRKSTTAGAVAAVAAAAITKSAISSYQDKGKEKKKKDRDYDRKRDSSAKTIEKAIEPSNATTAEPRYTKTYEPSNVKPYEPSNVKTYEPSRIQQDYFDDEIFDPNIFKKKETVVDKKETAPHQETVREIYQDWEDRYNEKPVSQADFFAPKELLENNNLPKVHPVDPNEGATDLHIYRAHDDFGINQPMVPPYPRSYSFTATKDGRSATEQAWPVPSLNLIQPTPPGSRAPSVLSVSVPPSPIIEPVKEGPREERRQEEANRAKFRVSWGENQFHHFEVQTPEIHRDNFVSDGDLKDQEKIYSTDEVTIEHDSPKSGQKTSIYQPYRPEETSKKPEPKEIASSTQFVRDEDDSTWESIVGAASKKSNKEKKQAKAAAAASTAAAVTTAAILSRDDDDRDYRRDTASVISNPFSDSHAAASTIASSTVASSIPSTSSVYQSPHYQPPSDLDLEKTAGQTTKRPSYFENEVTAEPMSIHMPGSFDEPPVAEKLAEEDWEAPTKKSTKGKEKAQRTDNIIAAQDVPRRVEPPPVPTYVPEPIKEVFSEPEAKLSKKDKKKKAKAAKRGSVDSWEESNISPLSSPTVERDIRDIEPPRYADPPRESPLSKVDSRPSESTPTSTSNGAAVAMAGGFAALVGSAMKQDQDRMAADLEHARRNLESAAKHSTRDSPASPPNGNRASNANEKSAWTPSTSVQDVDEFADVKTPKRKKDKRPSSSGGTWSPTIGSPLRTEVRHEDSMGAHNRQTAFDERPLVEAPQVPNQPAFSTVPEPSMSRDVYDSGYYAPDDLPRKENAERDSDEFFSAGSDEKEKSKAKAQESPQYDDYDSKSNRKHDDDDTKLRSKYDDDDTRSVVSSSSKYDDPEREERRRRRHEAKSGSRDQSRDRVYDFDEGTERRRRHHRRATDERSDDWDTRSTISEARSEANGERRRKHKRRESERDGSTESKVRSRSSAASEPGDLYDDHRSSRRRSKRDGDDDNASIISSSSRHDEDRSSKKEKEKEKRSSGLFGLFSKSKENLADTSKSSKSKDDDDEERKHRRRKHRSDRGSTYGSDDDDARSTISSSSRREKRSSRHERGDGDRRDSYDDKVHRSSHTR